jgi:hypothetical protein
MPKITIATMTWAHNPQEADLLAASIESLTHSDLPVVVADGGSIEGFTDRLRACHHVSTVIPRLGPGRLVGQIEATLAAAASQHPEYVLYTEPDKQWFFTERLTGFLAAAEPHAGAGILLASRDAPSFQTFPAGQQLTESLFNRLAGDALGVDGDTLYGPMLIRADLVEHVTDLHEDLGWGWRPYLMAVVMRLGHPLVCVDGDFLCPERQRGENDSAARIYRMEQLAQNVKGLAMGLKVDLSHPHFHI